MVNWTKWLGGRGSEGREECRLAERREESERSAVVLTQPLQSVWLQVAARHSVLKRETISVTTITHLLHSDPDGQLSSDG